MHTWYLLLTVVFGAQDASVQPDLAIVHVDVVDVAAGGLVSDQTVLIAGSRIDWIGPADDARVPAGTTVVEGAGKFLIPGLWDMHVHLQRDWDAEVSLPMFLAHGVTGVRDMASDVREPSQGFPGLPGLLMWRESIARGELVGPRLLALSSWPVAADAQLNGDAGALVDGFVERGADFIKVLQGLSIEAPIRGGSKLKEITDEARERASTKVACKSVLPPKLQDKSSLRWYCDVRVAR